MAHVDLRASVPQQVLSIVTKKVAGAILSQLVREAQRVTKDSGESGGGAEASPWLRTMEEQRDLYGGIRDIFDSYFDLYGEEEEEGGDE